MKQFIPGYYYFSSRFDSFFSALIYFVKYWLSYLTVFFALSDSTYITFDKQVLSVVVSLVMFYAIYDVLCYRNDHLSIENEGNSGIARDSYGLKFDPNHWLRAVICGFSLFILYETVNSSDFFLMTISMFILIISFLIHNKIQAHFRVYSFYMLYFLKPIIVGGWLLSSTTPYLLVIFSALYASCYIPNYAKRKLNNGEVKEYLNSINPILTSGIFLKSIIGFIFLLYDINFFWFLLIQISATLLEILLKKHIVGKK